MDRKSEGTVRHTEASNWLSETDSRVLSDGGAEACVAGGYHRQRP